MPDGRTFNTGNVVQTLDYSWSTADAVMWW